MNIVFTTIDCIRKEELACPRGEGPFVINLTNEVSNFLDIQWSLTKPCRVPSSFTDYKDMPLLISDIICTDLIKYVIAIDMSTLFLCLDIVVWYLFNTIVYCCVNSFNIIVLLWMTVWFWRLMVLIRLISWCSHFEIITLIILSLSFKCIVFLGGKSYINFGNSRLFIALMIMMLEC